MPTGNEPTTPPPPAYNPDPAVTGYVAPVILPPPNLGGDFYFTVVAGNFAKRVMSIFFALWHYAASVSIPDPTDPNKITGYTDPEFAGFTYFATPAAPPTPTAPWWQAPPPFIAHARPASACWILTFKFPGDPLPLIRQAVQNGKPYTLTVDKTLTDKGGVTWLRVWPTPELRILADEVQP